LKLKKEEGNILLKQKRRSKVKETKTQAMNTQYLIMPFGPTPSIVELLQYLFIN